MNILFAFLVRRKISLLFFRLVKIDHISHYCSLSSKILGYINIFIINRKLLAEVLSLRNAQVSLKLVL